MQHNVSLQILPESGGGNGPFLNSLQAVFVHRPPPIHWHAVHIQVVQQKCLGPLAPAVSAHHSFDEVAGVLCRESQLDSGHPVLAGQQLPLFCSRR